ncbi:MAG: inositol monophosphatase family protein, partial [Deltaproteobacteria bacterium]
MQSNNNQMKEVALAVALKAGHFLKDTIKNVHTIEYKGEIDIVTEADKMAEEIIVGSLQKNFPHHDILSEEVGSINRGSEFRWIIDPLDGTTNFAHAYPVFCVSIALEVAGDVVLGVIYNPMLDEMFFVRKGDGSFLNGKPILCSNEKELGKSLLATGFPYDIRSNQDNNLNYFSVMAKRARAIRRAGSAALDMAYLAMGRFDGFWELRLKAWDTAAGALLIREAGGMVTDLEGNEFTLSSPHILASNGKIHEQMLTVLK